MSITATLATAALLEIKNALDGGFLYIYAGPVPADATEALDMVSSHTELVVLSVDGDGVTGLTFASPVGSTLPKSSGEVWKGTIAFDGAEAAETDLTPTFFRFCAAGDDGRGDGTGLVRIQGSVGGPTSSAQMVLGTATLTSGNEQVVSIFNVTLTG